MSNQHSAIRPVFMVGCPRSGTTLTQTIIGTHPQVLTFPETGFFTYLYGDYPSRVYGERATSIKDLLRMFKTSARNAFGFANRNHHLVFSLLHQALEYCEVDNRHLNKRHYRMSKVVSDFVSILEGAASRSGKSVWLEKTPNHFAYTDEIKSFIPSAQFIHVVRNPMDTVASLRSAHNQYPHTDAWRRFSSVERCIHVWNEATLNANRHLGLPNHFVLSFDELVICPEKVVPRLLEFVGVPNVDANSLMRLRAQTAQSVVVPSEEWKAGISSPIGRSGLSKAGSLDKREIEFISLRASKIRGFN